MEAEDQEQPVTKTKTKKKARMYANHTASKYEAGMYTCYVTDVSPLGHQEGQIHINRRRSRLGSILD